MSSRHLLCGCVLDRPGGTAVSKLCPTHQAEWQERHERARREHEAGKPPNACVEVRKMNEAGNFQRWCIEHHHWLEEGEPAVSALDREIARLREAGLYREEAAP